MDCCCLWVIGFTSLRINILFGKRDIKMIIFNHKLTAISQWLMVS